LRLLLCLAARPGEVVSIDDLLDFAWSGVTVSPDSVYQAVTSLRRQLGDDPKKPAYIETVPRLGYRMVASVAPWTETPVTNGSAGASPLEIEAAASGVPAPVANGVSSAVHVAASGSRAGMRFTWAGVALTAVAVLILALYIAFLPPGLIPHVGHPAAPPADSPAQKSIAVLPFLDLTEGMKEEEFADGMTEELIDKLSKVPGLRVPTATSSFYFKNKQVALAEVAKQLGVVYVLDGSVRKASGRVRVAARLVRAENGYVLWSETYDRPFDDLIMVQDDIAGEVAKALRSSIAGETAPNAKTP
jgi:transcriptional activator of cad operon